MCKVLVVVSAALVILVLLEGATAGSEHSWRPEVHQDATQPPTSDISASSESGDLCRSAVTRKANTSNAAPLVIPEKLNLASEKKKFDAEICGSKKVTPSTLPVSEGKLPKVETAATLITTNESKKVEAAKGDTIIEKLPGNKVKEVKTAEETKKLSPKETVKKTVTHEVIKDEDTEGIKNETVTEKETKIEKTPSNATISKTVEKKVVKDKDGKDTGKETVSEKQSTTDKDPTKTASVTKTVEEKVVKGDDMEAEVEGKEEPVIGEEEKEIGVTPPANVTVKKTVVEHKVVKEMEKDGDQPQKEIKIQRETKTDVTGKKELETDEKIDASALENENGPKELILTQKKVEKFSDNETKEITVERKAEKLPTDDIVKKVTVESKLTKDTEKEGEKPTKEVTTQIEIEEQSINKTGKSLDTKESETKIKTDNASKTGGDTTSTAKEPTKTETKAIQPANKTQTPVTINKTKHVDKIKDLKRQVENIKNQVKEEEDKVTIESKRCAEEGKNEKEILVKL